MVPGPLGLCARRGPQNWCTVQIVENKHRAAGSSLVGDAVTFLTAQGRVLWFLIVSLFS